MTDLATLGIRVQSHEAEVAEDRLDGMAMAADRAENATDTLAIAARRADGAVGTMNVAVRQQTAMLAASRAGMGLTAAEGLNMGRQLTDVGVQMAMGMNPFMIAVQQGPQILDIFQMAAIRTGTTVTAAMRSMGAAIWTAMAPVLPIIAAIGAAAGAVWGGWSLTTRSLTKDIGDLTDGMGLSEDQMKRLAETGTSTTATAGDAFRGLGTTIKEVFQEAFGPQLDWVSSRFSEAMDWLTRVGGNAVKAFIGNWMGAFKTITATWRQIPNVIGDATFTAVSFVVEGIQKMINAGIDGINALLAAARALGPLSPLGAAAQGVGNLDRVNLSVNNPFKGAMSAFGLDARGAFAEGQALGEAMVNGFMDRWRANTRASGQARILADAGEAAAGRAPGARGGQQARGETIPLSRRTNISDGDPLRILSDDLITPLEMLADELRLIDGLARDASRGLASAFGESGRALGDLLTITTTYQSRLAEIALAEEQNRLTGAQADRERAQTQIGAYGDMAAAAKGFFKEGSDGWKAMHAIEMAYRIFQFSAAVQSMVLGNQETASVVANSMTKAAASTAAGAAKMFEFLGPFGFPAVAAMVALLAGLGLKGMGGKGGGYSPGATTTDPQASVQSSARAAQAGVARDQAARDSFVQRLAASVEVRVTADRQGLNAYVAETARREAAPMVAAGARQAVEVSRRAVPSDMARKQAVTLRQG